MSKTETEIEALRAPSMTSASFVAGFDSAKAQALAAIRSNPLAALTPAQLAAIRAVILEVIDDGDAAAYEFYEDGDEHHFMTEEQANTSRLDFCDEIARRIVARGAPAADHDFRPLPQNPNWCAFYGCTRSRENHGAPATVRGGTVDGKH